MHLILITISITLLLSQCRTTKMCFLQSRQIWIGCGSTDCAGFGLHEGTLTVCSGGRYLNLGDVHMGGKGGKWKWYPRSLFCMLKETNWRLRVNAKTDITHRVTPIFPGAEFSPLSFFQCPNLFFRFNTVFSLSSVLSAYGSLSICWQYNCTLTPTLASVGKHNRMPMCASIGIITANLEVMATTLVLIFNIQLNTVHF